MTNVETLYSQRLDISNSVVINCDSIDNIRTNDTILHELHGTDEPSCLKNSKEDSKDNKNNNIKIFRFKFNEIVVDELHNFSKIHKYDSSTDYKNAWKVWVEENSETIEREVCRLKILGFDGDVIDKMFKSSRYYFRKKSEDKKDQQKRRDYIKIDNALLLKMDEHIKQKLNTENYQPKIGFLEFCKSNTDVLRDTIVNMNNNGITDIDLIKDKVKKTYKNRYFNIIKIKK